MVKSTSRRLIMILLSITVLTYSAASLAHAVITESSLREHPINPRTATKVLLSFNSDIELSLSQIYLVSKGDQHRLLTVEPGLKPGQIIVRIPSLKTGNYALRLKIFAADGHLTKDVIRFNVSNSKGA